MKAAFRNHLGANGRKTDVPSLLGGLLASDGDPVGLVRDMHARIYSGDIGEDQFDRLLFSPSTADPIIRRVAKHVGRADRNVNTRLSPTDVTAMMQRIAAQLRADPFLVRTATPRTSNVDAKAYATDWYGLPRLAAMSVAIRRLIQAEHQLPAMIDAVIAGRAPPAMTILRPLPTYRRAKLGRLSVARQVELLAFYRGAVLADGNNNSSNPWKAIEASRDFLRKRSRRHSVDHHGPAGDPRRAFYFLDVIPEHRFAIG